MFRSSSWLFLPLGILVAGAAPGSADAPAAPGPASVRPAEASFRRFAEDWIGVQRRRAAREMPRLQPGARAPVAVYRAIDEDYRAELRATGRPGAPYVGVVHYTELVYACRDLGARDCSLADASPQTAIFRYRAGRWQY